MGRMSKADKAFKEKYGMTPVELVRHIREKGAKEGKYDKYFKAPEPAS